LAEDIFIPWDGHIKTVHDGLGWRKEYAAA